jgi:hypothetical protein
MHLSDDWVCWRKLLNNLWTYSCGPNLVALYQTVMAGVDEENHCFADWSTEVKLKSTQVKYELCASFVVAFFSVSPDTKCGINNANITCRLSAYSDATYLGCTVAPFVWPGHSYRNAFKPFAVLYLPLTAFSIHHAPDMTLCPGYAVTESLIFYFCRARKKGLSAFSDVRWLRNHLHP